MPDDRNYDDNLIQSPDLFVPSYIDSGADISTNSRWLDHSDGGALAMLTYDHLRQEHSLAQAAMVQF
jgi:hypothetical protein